MSLTETYFSFGFDKDTEYYNGCEWKKISEYKSWDRVLQYKYGSAFIVRPKEVLHCVSNYPFYEYEDNTLSICQTGNQPIVVIENEKEKRVSLKSVVESKKSVLIPLVSVNSIKTPNLNNSFVKISAMGSGTLGQCRELVGNSGRYEKFGFVVPSGMLVVRRHGRIYVTGDCSAE